MVRRGGSATDVKLVAISADEALPLALCADQFNVSRGLDEPLSDFVLIKFGGR